MTTNAAWRQSESSLASARRIANAIKGLDLPPRPATAPATRPEDKPRTIRGRIATAIKGIVQ